MFLSHQHAMPFLRGAGGFARAGGCGNAAGPGAFFQRGRYSAASAINSAATAANARAEQMGCDVVQRDSRAAEVAALKQRLQELERAA